ncbi:MAG: type VII secretion-associated serine protease mycosin, partial [Acidimicrobiales bacterium]
MSPRPRSVPTRAVALGAVLAAVVVLAGRPWAAGASNDPLFDQQWALARIGAPAAWATSTGTGVRIGIVDTGVDLEHEDLAGQVVA